MPSTGISVARKIAADALKLNWSGIEVRFALRCGVGVAIPLLISVAAGAPLAGASAAYGALVTGLASRQGVYRTRVGAMLVASAALAISGFAGAVTGPIAPLNVALLAVWALFFGMVASLGRSATVVAVNACVAYVLFSNPPYDAANPWLQAAMVFAGGVLQMLLLVVVWPLGGFRAERAALTRAYHALSQYATGLRADDLGLPDTESVSAVSMALADPQPFGGRGEIAAYQALADEAERLRGTLAALATDGHMLDDVGLSAAAASVRDVGHAAGALLDEVAAAVGDARAPVPQGEALHALGKAIRDLERTASEHAPYVEDARALAGQLRSALHSAASAADGGLAVEAELPQRSIVRWNPSALRRLFERLIANCSWGSPHSRHAIRLAVAVTLAVIVQHDVPLDHAQWIALTVVLVLRPDFSTTFTRGIARVAGTIGGALLASLIAALHPGDATYMALAIVFAGFAFALFNVSYALFSVAITGYVVYMLAFGGAPEHASAFDRVIASVLGGMLAFLAYAAWPTWTHGRVADDLANLISTQRRYIALVFHSYAEPATDERAIHAAQVAVWRARANAEATVDQMAAEPVTPRGLSVRSASGVLAATRRFGIASLTLHARVTRIAGAPHALIERFMNDLDAALGGIIGALQAGVKPGPLPPLRADQVALKAALDERGDAAIEVLVAETDLLVDSVNTVAAILSRTA